MNDNDLNKAERLRSECLSHAIPMTIIMCENNPKLEDFFNTTKAIEAFIKNAKE